MSRASDEERKGSNTNTLRSARTSDENRSDSDGLSNPAMDHRANCDRGGYLGLPGLRRRNPIPDNCPCEHDEFKLIVSIKNQVTGAHRSRKEAGEEFPRKGRK